MRQQAKRSKSSQTHPMTSMKSHGHLNSIRETSEEHQQKSPARQTAAQHHYGSASATSNPSGAEFISSNIRSQQNINYTTGTQNLTSGVEPHDGYPSVPHPQQQPNRPSRYFTHHGTNTHDYRGSLSPRLGSAFDAATQFRNPTHQSPTVTGRNAYGAREAMQAPSEQNSLYSDEDCFNEFIHKDVYENLHGQLTRSIDTVPGKPMAPTAFGQAHQALAGLGNDEPPWSSIDQRQHRQSTEPMLPRTFNFHDVTLVGESAYPYPGDLTRSHVSAFNQEIGDLIQNNHQAISGYGNQQVNGSPETVRQPHFPEHGYQQEPPPSDSNLVNVGTYPPASSSNARSSATASSTTPDPLPCSLCPKYFRGKYRRGNRSRHMRLKHGVKEEKYKCLVESCGKSFSRNDALLKHSRKRHPELRIAEPVRRKEEPNSMQNTVDQHNNSYSHSNQSSNIGQLFQTQPHSGGSLIQYDDDLRGVTGRL